MQIAATLGTDRSDGSGRMPLRQSARTLPSVSFPSSVVRSIIRMASFERPDLAGLLDGTRLERRDALVDAHLVHATDPVQERAGRARPADPGVHEGGGLLLRGGGGGRRAALRVGAGDPGDELAHGSHRTAGGRVRVAPG